MTNINTCFNCGKAINEDACPHCGYSFSLPFTCPRRIYDGIACIHTRKLCREGSKWEECKILRGNN